MASLVFAVRVILLFCTSIGRSVRDVQIDSRSVADGLLGVSCPFSIPQTCFSTAISMPSLVFIVSLCETRGMPVRVRWFIEENEMGVRSAVAAMRLKKLTVIFDAVGAVEPCGMVVVAVAVSPCHSPLPEPSGSPAGYSLWPW
jgi:hypothetical protein